MNVLIHNMYLYEYLNSYLPLQVHKNNTHVEEKLGTHFLYLVYENIHIILYILYCFENKTF